MEGDVELPGQVIELAVIKDELPKLLDDGQRFDELIWINAAGRVAGEIADVIRAGAASVQSDGLNSAEELDGVLGLDQPQLQVGAGRDLDVPAGELVGNRGQFAKLKAMELATGNPQPGHEGFLIRREVKQPLPFEAECVLAVRCLIRGSVLEQQWIGVEGMQLALDPFFGNQVVQVRLGGDGRRVRLEIREGESAIAQAGKQAFQVRALFGRERQPGNFGEGKGGVSHRQRGINRRRVDSASRTSGR